MEIKTFDEIMKMITKSCQNIWYNGTQGKEQTIIECATKIYIAQMKGGAE